MDIEKIKELMGLLEGAKLQKMVFKQGDFELHLEKEGEEEVHSRRTVLLEPPPEPIPSAKPEPAAPKAPVGTYVTSPMVGTFYSASAPDKPPFVKVGDQVTEGTIICIIEAMKVMNEVKAGKNGTVAEILVDSGHPVEFGMNLVRIV